MATIIFSDLICAEGDSHLLRLLQTELEGRGGAYVLWLQGEMGAGKTSLVRNFLYSIGLPPHTPVVSPTYTIMNEYKVGSLWYAHLDLYRADARFSLDELGVRDAREYRGVFMEWPLQAGLMESIEPTHVLKIENVDDGHKRAYTLERHGSIPT